MAGGSVSPPGAGAPSHVRGRAVAGPPSAEPQPGAPPGRRSGGRAAPPRAETVRTVKRDSAGTDPDPSPVDAQRHLRQLRPRSGEAFAAAGVVAEAVPGAD